jgi:hypothetical protein
MMRAVARRLLEDFDLDAPVRLLGVGASSLVRASGQTAVARPHEPAGQGALTLDV